MKLFYISENLEKLIKEFKITNEELLKIGNLNMVHIAEDYYSKRFEKNSFKDILKNQIKEVRYFKN